MERAEIDGVTVVWEQGDGPLQAELSFACGHRDEELDTLGLTNLLQHLVDPDGMTVHLSTTFSAEGTPAQVSERLNQICRDLSSLPLDKLPKVAAKTDPASRSFILSFYPDHLHPFGSLLSRRFGAHGLGLSRWPALDYERFAADQLSAHAARYFTRGNAVLALTGPPPSGLRLPLPEGTRNVHEPSFRQTHGSVWYSDEVAGVGMSLRAGLDAVSEMTWWLFFDRVTAAVKKARLGYTCSFEKRAIAPESCELGLVLQRAVTFLHSEPRRDNPVAAARVAETVVAALRQLAQDGPTPEELDGMEPYYSGPPAPPSKERMTELELFGYAESMTEAELAKMADVKAYEVRSVAASWLQSVLVVVPRGVEPDLPGFAQDACPANTHVPDGEVFKPSMFERFRGKSSALEYVVLEQTGVFTVDVAEAVHATPTADLVLLRQADQVWLGNVGHQCLTEITGYGRAGDVIWQAAPPQRRRQAF